MMSAAKWWRFAYPVLMSCGQLTALRPSAMLLSIFKLVVLCATPRLAGAFVWPQPMLMEYTSDLVHRINFSSLASHAVGYQSKTLQQALHRLPDNVMHMSHAGPLLPITHLHRSARRVHHPHDTVRKVDAPDISALLVNVTSPQEDNFHGVDESYELQVIAPHIVLEACTVIGALRGLETLAQLIHRSDDTCGTEPQLIIPSVKIKDRPRFPYRGFLLDTSRHFLSVSNILSHLDAMSANKMNVFHWHMVDDPSFPLHVPVLPLLSEKGAFHINMRYLPEDVQKVQDYAKERGIRVVVEIDSPGHTLSWGGGYPELLTDCYDEHGAITGEKGPLDPSKQVTYKAVEQLLAAVTEQFPDSFLHLGGDEVDFACWQSNPAVQRFMEDNNIHGYSQLESFYLDRVVDVAVSLNRTAVVWQDMFDDGARPERESVVFHVWKKAVEVGSSDAQLTGRRPSPTDHQGSSSSSSSWESGDSNEFHTEAGGGRAGGASQNLTYLDEMRRMTDAGYRVLLSAPWYLDHIAFGEEWVDYYLVEPLSFTDGGDGAAEKLVLGGEACLWGEYVDETNSLQRAWPRAAATAERLWSGREVQDLDDARERLHLQRCRMVLKGIPASPINPGFCPAETCRASSSTTRESI